MNLRLLLPGGSELVLREEDAEALVELVAARVLETLGEQGARPVEAVSFDEAARRLGVHKRTVQRLVAAGALRAVRVGSSPRIEVAELAAYIARRQLPIRRRRRARAAAAGSVFADRLRSRRAS